MLDLSWSGSGLQLMACSWDGSVAFVEFSEEELGKPLTLDEKVQYLIKTDFEFDVIEVYEFLCYLRLRHGFLNSLPFFENQNA